MFKRRAKITAVMTLIMAILALYASLVGVLDKNLYEEVVAAGTISRVLQVGSIAQDLVSIPLAVILAFASLMFLKSPGYKSLITILGLAWYFFYAYGLYVMQGQYTSIYIVYLGIFSLSIYSMLWGIISFKHDEGLQYHIPRMLRISIAIFLLMIVCVLGPAWIARMSFDIANNIPGLTYAVFILDLGIVFPALGQIAVMLFRKNSFGYILAGIGLLKSLTLCLSWAFAQWYSPIIGEIPLDIGMTALATILTIVSLLLFIPYIFKLKTLNKGEV